MLLLKENATVTMTHTRTVDLKKTCSDAEIVIAAAGRAKMLNSDYCGQDAVMIDVGINVDENGKLCGDVDYRLLMAKPLQLPLFLVVLVLSQPQYLQNI